MKKNNRLDFRVTDEQKKAIEKAAMESKSVAAFLLKCVATAIKYRRMIEVVEKSNLSLAAIIAIIKRQK